jgi:hypothetical protein
MLEIEVDDLGQGVHLCGLEVANELCQAFLELGVYTMSESSSISQDGDAYKQQAQSNYCHQ